MNDLSALIDAAEANAELGASGGEQYEDGRSLRFGPLNLLCVTDEKHFEVWREGTQELACKSPVTRDFAIEFLRKFRRDHKINDW